MCVACGWVLFAADTQAVTLLMSPPLNTSYTDSSHKLPTETSRPIERPKAVQKQPRGKGGQSGP